MVGFQLSSTKEYQKLQNIYRSDRGNASALQRQQLLDDFCQGSTTSGHNSHISSRWTFPPISPGKAPSHSVPATGSTKPPLACSLHPHAYLTPTSVQVRLLPLSSSQAPRISMLTMGRTPPKAHPAPPQGSKSKVQMVSSKGQLPDLCRACRRDKGGTGGINALFAARRQCPTSQQWGRGSRCPWAPLEQSKGR